MRGGRLFRTSFIRARKLLLLHLDLDLDRASRAWTEVLEEKTRTRTVTAVGPAAQMWRTDGELTSDQLVQRLFHEVQALRREIQASRKADVEKEEGRRAAIDWYMGGGALGPTLGGSTREGRYEPEAELTDPGEGSGSEKGESGEKGEEGEEDGEGEEVEIDELIE